MYSNPSPSKLTPVARYSVRFTSLGFPMPPDDYQSVACISVTDNLDPLCTDTSPDTHWMKMGRYETCEPHQQTVAMLESFVADFHPGHAYAVLGDCPTYSLYVFEPYPTPTTTPNPSTTTQKD